MNSSHLILTNQPVRPPPHAPRLRVHMKLPVYENAAVKNSGILIELPPLIVITKPRVFGSFQLTLQQSDTPASQVMMKRVGQPDCLILHQLPARMKAAHVVGEIPCHEAMFSSLNLLLEPGAVILEGWLLSSQRTTTRHHQKQDYPPEVSFGMPAPTPLRVPFLRSAISQTTPHYVALFSTS